MNSGTPETYERSYYTANSAFSCVQLLIPNKQWNVIKAKVWARLTPIWAFVPLSHQAELSHYNLIHFCLPVDWLDRHSWCKCPWNRYGTEFTKIHFPRFTDISFEYEELLTFQETTNEFSEPGTIGIYILHGEIRVIIRPVASPQWTMKCDKSPSWGTPEDYRGSCAA